jgi:hypothetical protein
VISIVWAARIEEAIMSTFVLKSAASYRGWMETSVGRFFVRVRRGMNDGRDIAARYDRLARMSRGELARHGLSRTDISRAALNGF